MGRAGRTCWEPERRLAFEVIEHPPPLRELSPWANLHPPHLDGWVRVTRGEFRIVPLGERRTRLERIGAYVLDLEPAFYWRPWVEALMAEVHVEVLEHFKRVAEL